LTQAYSSQQNGRAERFNRTLFEGMITMLDDSGLPCSFWAEAMLTFCFVKNRSPHAALDGGVPEARWKGSSPRRFIPTFIWLQSLDDNSKDGDSHAREVIMIGYEPHKKSYCIWDKAAKDVCMYVSHAGDSTKTSFL
jgi:hypothetical protein